MTGAVILAALILFHRKIDARHERQNVTCPSQSLLKKSGQLASLSKNYPELRTIHNDRPKFGDMKSTVQHVDHRGLSKIRTPGGNDRLSLVPVRKSRE
jgi:hypothetical protein